MPNRFARDTSVTALGDGRYDATIDEGWWIQRGPNGGYIAAIVLRAIIAEVADETRQPRSYTLHFVRPPAAGRAQVDVTIERQGRTLTTAVARLTQDGNLLALGLCALAIDGSGPAFADLAMPSSPPPDAIDAAVGDGPEVPIRGRYDTRTAIGPEPFAGSDGPAEVGGWIRLREPDPTDYPLVAAFTDAWYPAVFSRLTDMIGVPTIDLTVHFRNAPPAKHDWAFVRFRTRHASNGFLEEDGEVWAADGTLLAQSRQLALFLPVV